MKKTILTFLMSTALAVGSAQAETVFGNLGASGSDPIRSSGGPSLSTGTWRAIGFTAGGANLLLNSATIGLETTDAGSADIRLDLYSSPGIEPGSSLFNTSLTLAGNTPVAPFTFILDQILTAGATYFIVVRQTGGDATAFWRPPSAFGVPATAQNGSGWEDLGSFTEQRSSDGGASWTSTSVGVSQSISLNADVVPEPSTYALLALSAAGLGAHVLRRRRK